MMKKQGVALLYGWVSILLVMLVSSFIFALILRFTDLGGKSTEAITWVLGVLALVIGGIVTGLKGKEKGWLLGLLTGAGFIFITILLQYLGYNQSYSLNQVWLHVTYLFAGLVGGVIGVQINGRDPRSTKV
ncbi:TIGR04086 family membrane protein [Bacillaceae bacterium S4-13-58]